MASAAASATAPDPASLQNIRDERGFTFAVEPGIKSAGPNSYLSNPSRMRERPGQGPTANTVEAAWKALGSVEAMSKPLPNTVAAFSKQNLFAKAVHAAFYGHHPLVLSPDVIWLTIAQGLANHVDQNAEALRPHFVSHEGKKELVVERPGFVKGSPANDWEGVFPEFSEKIAANTAPGTIELIQNEFSTTGPVERVVSHITLMDTVQHYFSYTMCCGCGFPQITLSGAPEDWEKIRVKAEGLRKYDLDWWLDALLPALDQFVAASHGKPDLDFWRALCNINTGTSFPHYEPLTGWVQVFFPYLIEPGIDHGFKRFEEAEGGAAKRTLRRNTDLANYAESQRAQINVGNFGEEPPAKSAKGKMDSRFRGPPRGTLRGVKLELFPPAMSNAPFLYIDVHTGKKFRMAFSGGLTCLVQHPGDGAIEPKMGWAVLDEGEAAVKDMKAELTVGQDDEIAAKLAREYIEANPGCI